jgi:carbon storage regulator
MLVLSRQRDETIMIGDDIEITVVDIRGDKVRLGITAPTRIAVHRKEVWEAIKRENEQAARLSGASGSELSAIRPGIPLSARTGPASRASSLSSGHAPPIAGSISPQSASVTSPKANAPAPPTPTPPPRASARLAGG